MIKKAAITVCIILANLPPFALAQPDSISISLHSQLAESNKYEDLIDRTFSGTESTTSSTVSNTFLRSRNRPKQGLAESEVSESTKTQKSGFRKGSLSAGQISEDLLNNNYVWTGSSYLKLRQSSPRSHIQQPHSNLSGLEIQ